MPAPLEWPPRGGVASVPSPDGRPGRWVARDSGRLWIAERFRPCLETLNGTDFASVFDLTAGTVVREIGPRRTARLDVRPRPLPGGPSEIYLKRFGRLSWRERIKNWIRLRIPDHGAAGEFRAICALTRLGIPTVEPLAYGESAGRSLLLTAGLTGYRDLKELLQSRHPLLRDPAGRDRIAAWLAEIARRLHGAGFHHQDLYLNHVLVGPPERLVGDPALEDAPLDLRLIDLGRVRHRQPLGRRWVLKDLAQLHYSSAGASSAERMRFFRRYLGRRLTPRDRALVRALVQKSAAIDRHTRRHAL